MSNSVSFPVNTRFACGGEQPLSFSGQTPLVVKATQPSVQFGMALNVKTQLHLKDYHTKTTLKQEINTLIHQKNWNGLAIFLEELPGHVHTLYETVTAAPVPQNASVITRFFAAVNEKFTPSRQSASEWWTKQAIKSYLLTSFNKVIKPLTAEEADAILVGYEGIRDSRNQPFVVSSKLIKPLLKKATPKPAAAPAAPGN